MKKLEMLINKRTVSVIYVDDEVSKQTYLCCFASDAYPVDKFEDKEVLDDLKKIDNLHNKKSNFLYENGGTKETYDNWNVLDNEISDMLMKYTDTHLSPIFYGYFDTEVWSDSRNRISINHSNYLEEEILIISALNIFLKHIQEEYQMNFDD